MLSMLKRKLILLLERLGLIEVEYDTETSPVTKAYIQQYAANVELYAEQMKRKASE